MVQSQFQNIGIECWLHAGRGRRRLGMSELAVCLFQSTSAPCASILLAINELEAGGPPGKRTISLAHCHRQGAILTLRLRFVPATDALRVLHVSADEAAATVEMTAVGLHLLRQSLMIWRDGAEDFGLSARHSKFKERELGDRDLASGELWFWGPSYVGS